MTCMIFGTNLGESWDEYMAVWFREVQYGDDMGEIWCGYGKAETLI
nr:MAG TPA: hypothetical protein [Caudoviricetes sp.]DAS78468.1 MAG TPA: hypothetical protein [Caudoviricetes sp.]